MPRRPRGRPFLEAKDWDVLKGLPWKHQWQNNVVEHFHQAWLKEEGFCDVRVRELHHYMPDQAFLEGHKAEINKFFVKYGPAFKIRMGGRNLDWNEGNIMLCKI